MTQTRELVDWIIAMGLISDSIEEILTGVSERLTRLGYPLVRASIAMPSIDPLQKGSSVSWSRSSSISLEIQEHGEAGDAMFRRSPISYLLSRDIEVGRWRLPPDGDATGFPLLSELTDLGATDYLVKLARFPGGTALAGIGFSLAVDSPEGFSDSQIAALDEFLPALALACYRIAAMRVATDMLAVYTGARTSGRILSGQTRRGNGEAIHAAILLADIKSFTALNERFPPERIVGWLNEHFDAIGGPVEQFGGEILKFMGDSLLAIFPTDIEEPANACERALSAAKMAIEANATINRARLVSEKPELLVDIVLHIGDVFYGNVGAARRLDFTAIGRAVNEAARMEKLCDTVERNLLASELFASHVQNGFERLGFFTLKGVSQPAAVYGLSRDPDC
ncbi:adenylate/guanylate cyclase domain-containing protein (plasmid) [Rhizobium sp. CCGE531]|nr:adenylate/guanylate cyclase domain-containing protein [Rhizobium sp. CCGE531]AYG76605.1 adenylate/guanylate cyclase domain-containing protein [Rhizobium sp. CCGE532]